MVWYGLSWYVVGLENPWDMVYGFCSVFIWDLGFGVCLLLLGFGASFVFLDFPPLQWAGSILS